MKAALLLQLLVGLAGCKLLGFRPPLSETPCGSTMEFLSHLPVELADLRGLVPLGSLNPPGHTLPTHHIYFITRLSDAANPESDPAEVAVYAPGNAEIVAIERREAGGVEDYSLHFKTCSEVRFYFYHLNSLSPAILEAAGGMADAIDLGDFEVKFVNVSILGGMPIGTAGRPGFFGFDMGVVDMRQPPKPFANPARYAFTPALFPPGPMPISFEQGALIAPTRLYQFCPVDYFAPAVRASLESRFSNYDGSVPASGSPPCFDHMQDVPGTAQGNWFRFDADNVFYNEDTAIALAPYNVTPATLLFSVGTSQTGLAHGTYSFGPLAASGQVNRPFAAVTPGAPYAFEGLAMRGLPVGGVLVVEVVAGATSAEDQLLAEYVPGASSAAALLKDWSFGAGAVRYSR